MKQSQLRSSLALAVVMLLSGSSAQARFDGGGGGFDGGGGFRGGAGFGGGGGAYRFSAAPLESAAPIDAAPVERVAPMQRPAGGGGGSFGGGGGGWADQPGDRALDQGYRGSHPAYGAGSRTPWTGHNISADQFRRLNEGSWNGNRSWRSFDNDRLNRTINLETNFYNRSYGGWNDGWANGGYWGSRPWGYGWYSWEPNTWGWWGGASVGWGLAALAGAEVITNLVNAAAEQQSPVIDVPDSDYQLNYGTVDSVGSAGADFSYAVAGSPPVKGAANCQQGLLDGQVPSTAAQAQLLNAACQVAYGPDPKGTPLPETLAGALPGWLRELLVLALGAGIAVGLWQVLDRRRQQPPSRAGSGHHPRITSG